MRDPKARLVVQVSVELPLLENGCDCCRFALCRTGLADAIAVYDGHELVSTEEAAIKRNHCALFDRPLGMGSCDPCITLRRLRRDSSS